MTDVEYGMTENVARAFNVTPAQAERAIRDAQDATGGPVGFRWFALELRRIDATFAGDELPTDTERTMLIELARRANDRGYVVVPRRELAEAVGISEREIGHGIEWGEWRRSFSARRMSSAGRPAVDRYALRDWPSST
jgi:hypothetical protein